MMGTTRRALPEAPGAPHLAMMSTITTRRNVTRPARQITAPGQHHGVSIRKTAGWVFKADGSTRRLLNPVGRTPGREHPHVFESPAGRMKTR
jgi:hypothetical protein